MPPNYWIRPVDACVINKICRKFIKPKKEHALGLDKSQKRSYGFPTYRMEALSDGIFGVSLTLLVLELKIPTIPPEFVAQKLNSELLAMWPNLLIYVMTFLLVGVVWGGHNIKFSFIHSCDRNLVWINNLLLLFVAFVPFPTACLGRYPEQRTTLCLYGSTMLAITFLNTLTWWYVLHKHFVVADLKPEQSRQIMKLSIAPVFIYPTAMLLALVNVKITLAIYIILPIYYMFPNKVDIKWGGRPFRISELLSAQKRREIYWEDYEDDKK
jgi:uncharacterized membrane protein